MQDYYTPKGKQLTIHERQQIQRWKLEGRSNREIARLLGKAPQTIHNEIKRGLVRQQAALKESLKPFILLNMLSWSIKKIASVLLDPLDSVSKIGRLLNTTCVRTIPLR
ncbi:transposase [Streptococcus dysgalactiae subsp. equisimilis 167]|nr:transposase [Streptococcus dysgalactiae subsp. equisimilis 167]